MLESQFFYIADISIHPPREGWDHFPVETVLGGTISIHPPREGWDDPHSGISAARVISIHPPREGWDAQYPNQMRLPFGFQSTHPVRGGTFDNGVPLFKRIFQSTHPVRGGTWRPHRRRRPVRLFQSTHPVRGGTRPPAGGQEKEKSIFQSTHPVRGGTSYLSALITGRRYFNPPTP